MNTYIINGVECLAVDDRLYTKQDTTHTLSELEHRGIYLYEGKIVQLRDKGEVFSSIEIIPITNTDNSSLVRKDEFTEARPLERIVPEGVHKCSKCGGLAGSKEAYDEPNCFNCP